MSRVTFKDKHGFWPDLNQYTTWAAMTGVYSLELGKQALASDMEKLDRYRSTNVIKTMQAKCPCCGSRQYVYRQTARICAYCRSEQ